MPGLVAFGRRWSVGSDDLIVPALFLIICNSIWVIVLACSLPSISAEQMREKQAFDAIMAKSQPASLNSDPGMRSNGSSSIRRDMGADQPMESLLPLRFLRLLLTGFVVLFLASVLLEGGIAYVSTRGGVMQEKPRHSMNILIYLRASVLLIQFVCCILGIVWLGELYKKYYYVGAAQILIAVIGWQLLLLCGVLLTVCCVYDPTGRKWLKVVRHQCNSENHDHSKCHPGFKHSGSPRKSWKQSETCHWFNLQTQRSLFEDSLAEIAKLLSEFFSDEDIVPSDLVAGMMLLRHKQKRAKEKALEQADNSTYQFLSGAAITPGTEFLNLEQQGSLDGVREIRYYMQYALAAYGWLFYMTNNKAAVLCDLINGLRCCGCCRGSGLYSDVEVIEDNCCFCDLNALKLTLPSHDIQLVYVNFHCGIGQTPFYVAVDHMKQCVVLCIRGTLSLRDLITDLSAETEEIQTRNKRQSDWLAHRGIVRASEYVLSLVNGGRLFEKAFDILEEKSEKPLGQRNLVIVGHSLGGGIATVLGLKLREAYPTLRCFVFSPPGGLLSWSAAEATRGFITTVVVGKDVVARMGLAQMDYMKAEMLSLLKNCKDTKWKIIGHSLPCCRADFSSESPAEPLLEEEQPSLHSPAINSPLLHSEQSLSGSDITENNTLNKARRTGSTNRFSRTHSRHQRLYMPGKILHVVRTWERLCRTGDGAKKGSEPVYTAIWADLQGFDEVLVSPVMVHDHMPEGVIDGLDKLLNRCEKAVADAPKNVAQEYRPMKTREPPSSPRPAPQGPAPLATPDIGLKTFESNCNSYHRSTSGPAGLAQEELDAVPPLKSDVPPPKAEGKKNSVSFQVGLSSSRADVVDEDLWESEGDPDVESAWEDIYRQNGKLRLDENSCWTENSSMVPEVNSVARLQDLDQLSEAGSMTEPRAGFRPVATYSGGHLKDVGGDTYLEVAEDSGDEMTSSPSGNRHESLGKARSEAWLSNKDDTNLERGAEQGGKLHRTREREDIRYGSLDEEQPGKMARSHEMEEIASRADSLDVFREEDSEDNND